MPFARLISCLDIAGGRVVKGVRFRNLVDMGDPIDLAAMYSEGGVDELVLLDIAASSENRLPLQEMVAEVADRVSIPFMVGGGVHEVGDAERLLDAGADKISINSGALAKPKLITEVASLLGTQAVVVAIDAYRGKVYSRSGTMRTDRKPDEWAREAQDRGAGEILLTSIDTDGTQGGYHLPSLRAVAGSVTIPVIASGGAGSADDVAAALDIAQAALLASLLHTNPTKLSALRADLRTKGIALRDVD